MAEAIVEEHPTRTQPARFYCHICNVEINIPSSEDYTCPLCSGGFVEELPEGMPLESSPLTGGGFQRGRRGSSLRRSRSRSNTSGIGGGAQIANSLVSQLSNDGLVGGMQVNDLESLRNDIATLLTSRNGPNLEITIEPGTRRTNVVTLGGAGGAAGSGGGGGGGNNAGSSSSNVSGSSSSSSGIGAINIAGGRVRPSNLDRLDNVLFDFLQSIPLSGNVADFGNSHMFFMGNPADYAWGREGLDTIVTQMLNQMETSGPPPLSKQKIDAVAKVEVSNDDVERKLQCSVCWEDFQLNEVVRKLPCAHIYHEQCIVPWLKLHGTCPICRKSLCDGAHQSHGQEDEDIDESQGWGEHDVDATTETTTTCPLHGGNDAAGNTDSSQTTTATTGTTTTRAAAPTRNHVFSFDDENMNLD